MTNLKTESIPNTTTAMKREADNIAIIYYLIHIIFLLAREAGIEPTLTVLETALLPLEDSRK